MKKQDGRFMLWMCSSVMCKMVERLNPGRITTILSLWPGWRQGTMLWKVVYINSGSGCDDSSGSKAWVIGSCRSVSANWKRRNFDRCRGLAGNTIFFSIVASIHLQLQHPTASPLGQNGRENLRYLQWGKLNPVSFRAQIASSTLLCRADYEAQQVIASLCYVPRKIHSWGTELMLLSKISLVVSFVRGLSLVWPDCELKPVEPGTGDDHV